VSLYYEYVIMCIHPAVDVNCVVLLRSERASEFGRCWNRVTNARWRR